MEISFPFCDGPPWLSALTFSRDGDAIVVEAVRRSGTLLGSVRIDSVRFNQLADMLLSERNAG